MFGLLSAFFINPLFLLGAATAAIPLIIHLIYKKKAPELLFSTLRFLRLSVERTSHRQRLQDLMLLILRMLLFGLLAIALAKPFIRSGSLFRGHGSTTSVAIVMDNSYSMACELEGRSRYSRAKELAQGILKGLDENQDSVALVFTSGRESVRTRSAKDKTQGEKSEGVVRFGVLTHKINSIYEAVVSSEVSSEQGNVLAAIHYAYGLMAESKDANKEIYVLTDMQSLSWSEARADWSEDVPKDIPLVIANCGREGYKNLAITDVSIRSRGRAVGIPVTIQARIFNAGMTAQRTAVGLYVKQQKQQFRSVEIEPAAAAAVSFVYVFDEPGAHTGYIALETDDSLPVDNKRYFQIDVTKKIKALLATDARSAVEFLNDDFYLKTALDPYYDRPELSRSVIAPVPIDWDKVDEAELKTSDVTFLLNIREFSRTRARMLARYVDGGGNIVIFLGDRVSRASYMRSLNHTKGLIEKLGGLLPAEIGSVMGDATQREKFMKLGDLDYLHPVFQTFRGLPSSFFEKVHLYQWYELIVPQGSSSQILGTLEDGKPFLVAKRFGQGNVFLFCASAGAKWGNLPATPFFLPLVHQIVYYLTAATEQKGDYVAGSPVRFPVMGDPSKFTVQVTDPIGRVTQLSLPKKSKAKSVVFEDTHATGVYHYSVSTPKGAAQEGVFVINPDPDECDLKTITNKDVRNILGTEKVYFVSEPKEIRKITSRLRQGLQLWNLVLFIVLGIAIFECFLANKTKPEGETPRMRRAAVLAS